MSEKLVPSPARFAVMGGQVEERGGSWNNEARNARCAYRNRNNPDNRNNNLGFRALPQLAWVRDLVVTGQIAVAPRTGGVCRGELARPVPGRWLLRNLAKVVNLRKVDRGLRANIALALPPGAVRPGQGLLEETRRVAVVYSQVYAFANLYRAFRRARRGKRDRDEVAAFEFDLEENLLQVRQELATRTYRPGPYRSFYVRDAKRRWVSAAPFRDRVVHHALVNVIEPLFEPRFIGDSYANRVGKGTHRALDRCQQFARQYCYVLQCDVRQFFPSVDHAILRAQLDRVIGDEDVMWLVDRILASGEGVLAGEYEMVWFPDDDLLAILRPRGLPIGNLTSQFWANVYLNDLDQFVKRTLRCRAYLRYADDLLFFADDKPTLHGWRGAAIGRSALLRLTLHERRAQVYPVTEGIPFLGFRVFPDHRRLKSRRGHAARRRLQALARQCAAGRVDVARLSAGVQGWVAHAAHGDTWGLRRSVLGTIVV